MTDEEFLAWLKKEEGVVRTVYKDSLGYDTIGVGRLVDKRKRGAGLSDAEIDYLLQNDVDRVVAEVNKALPWVKSLTSNRKAVLYAMAFQMGINGLLGFKNTLKMIERGDYEGAAKGMLNSKWAKSDSPARAKRTAELMRKG